MSSKRNMSELTSKELKQSLVPNETNNESHSVIFQHYSDQYNKLGIEAVNHSRKLGIRREVLIRDSAGTPYTYKFIFAIWNFISYWRYLFNCCCIIFVFRLFFEQNFLHTTIDDILKYYRSLLYKSRGSKWIAFGNLLYQIGFTVLTSPFTLYWMIFGYRLLPNPESDILYENSEIVAALDYMFLRLEMEINFWSNLFSNGMNLVDCSNFLGLPRFQYIPDYSNRSSGSNYSAACTSNADDEF